MSVLRSLESKIAGLVEGTFSRAFRSEVRPVEIARKLAREMEEHKSLSVSRTYVPNEYRVFLSPRDRERFADYEDALADELAGYLLEYARRERLALLSRPVIEFETDDRLGSGEFGIQTRVVQPGHEPASRKPRTSESGRTMIYSSAGESRGATGGASAPQRRKGAAADRRQADGGRAGRGHARAQPRVRRGIDRPERVAPACRDPSAGRIVGVDRPRLDQWIVSQRAADRRLPKSSGRATRSRSARR